MKLVLSAIYLYSVVLSGSQLVLIAQCSAADDEHESSPAKQFASALSALSRNSSGSKRGTSSDAARETFQSDVAMIAAGAKSTPLSKWAEADLIALMHSNEIMKNRELTLGYAFELRKRAPKCQEWVLPAIRCLLNLNRVQEAETIVKSADLEFPPGALCRSGHYAMFAAFRQKNDNIRAVAEMDSHLKHLLDTAFYHGSFAPRVGRYLELRQKLSQDTDQHVLLRSNIDQLRIRAEDVWTGMMANDSGPMGMNEPESRLTDEYLIKQIAVFRILRHLTDYVQPAEVGTLDARMLKSLGIYISDSKVDEKCLDTIGALVREVPSHSHYWSVEAIQQLQAECVVLRKALNRLASSHKTLAVIAHSDKLEREVGRLERRLFITRSYRLYEGLPPDIAGDSANWLLPVVGKHSGSDHIILLWSPQSRVGPRDILAAYPNSGAATDRAALQLIIPSAGYRWDEARNLLVQGGSRSLKEEESEIRRSFVHQKINVDFQLVSLTPVLKQFLDVSLAPIMICVDDNGCIRRLEIVDEARKTEAVFQQFQGMSKVASK